MSRHSEWNRPFFNALLEYAKKAGSAHVQTLRMGQGSAGMLASALLEQPSISESSVSCEAYASNTQAQQGQQGAALTGVEGTMQACGQQTSTSWL